jgi:hypothetical protein
LYIFGKTFLLYIEKDCILSFNTRFEFFCQTLAEDELRGGTPAESLAGGSELNESFIFHSDKNLQIIKSNKKGNYY